MQSTTAVASFWIRLTPAQRVVYYTAWQIANNGGYIARSARDGGSKSLLRDADCVSGGDLRILPNEFVSKLEKVMGDTHEKVGEPSFFQKSILGKLLREGRLTLP